MNNTRHHGGWIGSDTCWEENIPWWRLDATDYVAAHLPAGARVLEWGSGASTIWLAQRCAALVSLELDTSWAQQVAQRLDDMHLLRVSVLLFHPEYPWLQRLQEYADFILANSDECYDLVVVDGRCRARCLGNARSRVKVGGMLLLDNSERVEYIAAYNLLRSWPKFEVGDEGWQTTVWTRPADWIAPNEQIQLPVAEA